MKKIICLIEQLEPAGAQRQLVGLSSMLVQQGYDVELWSWVKQDFFDNVLADAGVKNRFIEEACDKKKRIFILRTELLKAHPDVVISYLDTPSMVACIAKATGGKFKLIVSDRNTTQKLTLRGKIKFFLNRVADYIVPNSFSQQGFINKHYPHLSRKVKTITNFVDTTLFKPCEAKGDRDISKIIVVARIAQQKNPLFLIEVIKTLVDRGNKIAVDWYGRPLDKDLYENCLAKIREYQLSDIFNFLPDTKQIAQAYPQYDLFCLPSLHEGFPNVLCEAMSCGLPVACSAVSDVPCIVEDGINGYLFSPTSIDEAVKAMEKILKMNIVQRKNMGELGRLRIEKMCSKDAFINSYIELLTQ